MEIQFIETKQTLSAYHKLGVS